MPTTAKPFPMITENITAYMRDIKQYPRIDHKREAELSLAIHTGTAEECQQAMDELICCNLRLVVKIAHDFKRFGVTFADLVAEGNCGLITAARKFDPSKGARFSCYAAWWIKQNMRQAVANQTRTVRIPGGAAQKVLKAQKLATAFVNKFNREPTDQELADMLGCTLRALQTIKEASIKLYSVDDALKEDGDTTFNDMLADMDSEEDAKAKRYDSIQNLKTLLTGLRDRERFIIQASFGIDMPQQPDNIICQETGMPVQALTRKRRRLLSQLHDGMISLT